MKKTSRIFSHFPFILICCLSFFLAGCGDSDFSTSSISATATFEPPKPGYETAQNPNPTLINNSDKIEIVAWSYTSPNDDSAKNQSLDRAGFLIEDGVSRRQATIRWDENQFDLRFGGFPCSTAPTLVIADGSIELFPNDWIWDDCDAMEVFHRFEVELQTDIPPDQWTYQYRFGDERYSAE